MTLGGSFAKKDNIGTTGETPTGSVGQMIVSDGSMLLLKHMLKNAGVMEFHTVNLLSDDSG